MSPWNVAWKRYQTEESVVARKWREGRERAEAAEWEWNQRHSPNRKGSAMGREIQDRVGVALVEERKEGMVRSGIIDMDECSRKAVAHGGAPRLWNYVASDFDDWGGRKMPSPAGWGPTDQMLESGRCVPMVCTVLLRIVAFAA